MVEGLRSQYTNGRRAEETLGTVLPDPNLTDASRVDNYQTYPVSRAYLLAKRLQTSEIQPNLVDPYRDH